MARLLIVDDDESVRKVLRFRLKHLYEIIDTGCPEDAVALALQQKPDAILLDLMMPHYSGFEVCQSLSSMSFTQLIPIFIVSGEPAPRYKDFCTSLGAKGYFQKPVDFEALEARLRSILETQRVDRRAEPRVKLRVMLKIKGTTANGQALEAITTTENVSAHSFLAACAAPLTVGSTVDVYIKAAGEQLVAKARAVRMEWPETPGQRCAFRFLSEPSEWIMR